MSSSITYVSTRGVAPSVGFEDVLLEGLAPDGGLYMPSSWPILSKDALRSFRGMAYEDIAAQVMQPFVGDAIASDVLTCLSHEAYGTFSHLQVAPLLQIGSSDWLLELFHGPTLAFKDVAMQMLARLFDEVLTRRGERVLLLGATSGDTGAAAIEAFRGRQTVDIVILHPKGRIAPLQRLQMTTIIDDNVHNIEIDGTFDDCQGLVKSLFGDVEFRKEISIAGVNSINWARVMPQIVYYITSAVALGAPECAVSFVVPTGNFGNVFAGYAAKAMGLPVERLLIACNSNDTLYRALDTGRYETRGVQPTMSPAMDIQISSNFERLLFEVSNNNTNIVQGLMGSLEQSGRFNLPSSAWNTIKRQFDVGRADEKQTLSALRRLHEETGLFADPHTAVGLHVAYERREGGGRSLSQETPLITLATAHPAKFPQAIGEAGLTPPPVESLAGLESKPEHCTALPNDVKALASFIRAQVGG
ncbi:MAG: threonine synthase [Parvularculales bacterium]